MNFTDSKITEIYFLVDEFNQQFQKELAVHIVGNPAKRPPILSSSEVMTNNLSSINKSKPIDLYVQYHI